MTHTWSIQNSNLERMCPECDVCATLCITAMKPWILELSIPSTEQFMKFKKGKCDFLNYLCLLFQKNMSSDKNCFSYLLGTIFKIQMRCICSEQYLQSIVPEYKKQCDAFSSELIFTHSRSENH